MKSSSRPSMGGHGAVIRNASRPLNRMQDYWDCWLDFFCALRPVHLCRTAFRRMALHLCRMAQHLATPIFLLTVLAGPG